MNVSDRLTDAKKQLEKLEKQGDEIDYYVNTGSILFQYYDILENGKDVNAIPKASANGKSILKYFLAPTQSNAKEETSSNMDRATLLEKYMYATDTNYIKQVEHETRDKCPHCDSLDRNIMLNDGLIYCNVCNTVEYIIIDHERPSYKDPPKEIKRRFLKVKVSNPLLVACAA